jgi:hypothetical protein
MNPDKEHHLNGAEIMSSVIDESEVSETVLGHLSECSICSGKKEQLEQDLSKLGSMAERFSPMPAKRVLLPEGNPRRRGRWFWNWQAASGFAVAVTVMLVMVWWTPNFRTPTEVKTEITNQEMIAAEDFMIEVDVLVDNALPSYYLDISGESYSGMDEDFMEFMVPSEDNNISGYKVGGEKLC